MQLSRSSRQLSALRSCRPSTSFQHPRLANDPSSSRRHVHHVPKLTYEDHFRAQGIGRMLSPSAFDLAWTQYQSHLVEQLNRLTEGTKDGDRSTKDLLLSHARNPSKASLFNHASMAWNTHHTLTTLSPEPMPISNSFEKRIKSAFSSIESLKSTFLATANAMFGPGFVWLVKNNNAREHSSTIDPQLGILATYIAGSPLAGAHFRRQSTDLNTENPADINYDRHGMPISSTSVLRSTAGSFGNASGSFDSKLGLGGAQLEVMLGVCTWPHFWMQDFGVAGKRKYLEAWWESIDWAAVERNGVFEKEGFGRVRSLSRGRYG